MSQFKNNWGFPRWSEYRTERGASEIKMCDFQGCEQKGEHPAPKSPHTEEKWWFCADHAAEYNKGWNFFEGMKDEEAKAYAKAERQKSGSYAKADAWGWGGKVDEHGLTRIERDAFAELELEPPAPLTAIKKQYRLLAKKFHPDLNRGDTEAEKKFQRLTFAYEILKAKPGGFTKS